jgi:hypothetical protein
MEITIIEHKNISVNIISVFNDIEYIIMYNEEKYLQLYESFILIFSIQDIYEMVEETSIYIL